MLNPTMITQNDVELLKGTFATREEIQQVKSDLLDKLDSILKEIVASREEETILSHRVSNHEDRITALEDAKSA